MSLLLDKTRLEIKLGTFAAAPATAIADANLVPQVQEYRRGTGSRMTPLDRDDIGRKIPTADYHVSRKVDGEFTVLVYRDDELFTINPGGTIRIGMPWQQQAAQLLAEANVEDAFGIATLCVGGGQGMSLLGQWVKF